MMPPQGSPASGPLKMAARTRLRIRDDGLIMRCSRSPHGDRHQRKRVGKVYPWGVVLNETLYPAERWAARAQAALDARRPLRLAGFTDYPIEALGDLPARIAPIRACQVIAYDANKYCAVIVHGSCVLIKRCYVYRREGRLYEVPAFSHCRLVKLQRFIDMLAFYQTSLNM